MELSAPSRRAPLDLAVIGKWLERVPDLRLDGERPTSKDLQHRLNRVLAAVAAGACSSASSPGSVGRARSAAMAKTVPGDRKPASSGFWLHFLRNLGDLRIWWAATDAPEEYEDALLDAFAAGVPAAERAALHGPGGRPAVGRAPLPVGRPQGDRHHEPAAPRGQGAGAAAGHPDRGPAARGGRRRPRRGEARGRRPAPGRGAGRIASAAAYAAQGSPRKVHEPIILSPEGLERLEAELAGLLVQRPGVIRRIATAREHGDLKENAEYHAAREEQGFLEGRIKALEAKLKIAVVVAPTERGARSGSGRASGSRWTATSP